VIFEEQTYTMQVGKADLLVEDYQEQGLAILRRHLGELEAFWIVEVGGDIDQVIQVWRFDSHGDRADRRDALMADPEWRSFAATFGYLIKRREMRLLRGTPISPDRNGR
jgi:hypothetical protein